MTGFYVRWGKDVDAYVRALASEHITTLSTYCEGVAERIVATRARKRGVATITRRVERAMIDGPAQHRFRRFGFHFLLQETPNQPARARKREFVLNFATPPKFAPADMPQRLRRRPGRQPTARPAKKKRRVTARTCGLQKRIARHLYKFHKLAKRARAAAATVVSRNALTTWEIAVKLAAYMHMLREGALRLWRRRPRVAFWPRSFNGVLTRVREPRAYAPVRARLEPRLFQGSGLPPLLLYVLAPNEPQIDWDAFPFGEPPEERERLPV